MPVHESQAWLASGPKSGKEVGERTLRHPDTVVEKAETQGVRAPAYTIGMVVDMPSTDGWTH